jgi:hypothetical protein
MLNASNHGWRQIPSMTLHELRLLVPSGYVIMLDFSNNRMKLRKRREGEPEHTITRLFDQRLQGN